VRPNSVNKEIEVLNGLKLLATKGERYEKVF